ncbi:hypothetical protein OCGS_1376 [Oceaniovalibus guishaninsula JLT2003]|uniref:Response regulatory domain-containing protein n=1 Tax=Oceaniovalibus guishaninsula JLT2003 TaxID=1231392 RepID=K2HAI2_9RHOB|nr:hypothetical protein [Oceaniovalibus guishaninsula]EKE44538.1 hypothetical protein OCGS_1376 [Oceaniovalibus guishaninsula JLT2003]
METATRQPSIFVVMERDPFVAADLCDWIARRWPDARILLARSFAEAEGILATVPEGVFAVIDDTFPGASDGRLSALLPETCRGIVLVSRYGEAQPVPRHVMVDKPFTSAVLDGAYRRAMAPPSRKAAG